LYSIVLLGILIVIELVIKQLKTKIMYKTTMLLAATFFLSAFCFSQIPSKVDYDAFEKLVKEVKDHRAERLVSIEKFNEMSKMDNVVILDTRSKSMYEAKHVKGAIHLNFSDFTQENLETLFPSKDVTILIYCNNNFDNDKMYFPTKSFVPPVIEKASAPPVEKKTGLGITMALNIPTYINLYGYGYKNVYELSELISIFDQRIEFEGTAVSSL
jgi:hypothetical protein